MATRNSTSVAPAIPVSWLDDLNAASNRLQAFQAMLSPFVLDLLSSDIHRQAIATGMFDILDDVIQAHRDLSSQVEGLLEAYR